MVLPQPFWVTEPQGPRGKPKTLDYGMRVPVSISYRGPQQSGQTLAAPFERKCFMKAHKIFHWYNVLRVNYRFTAFQAIVSPFGSRDDPTQGK